MSNRRRLPRSGLVSYVMWDRALFDDPQLRDIHNRSTRTHHDIRVTAKAIARHGENGRECFPSDRQLAKFLKCSRKVVTEQRRQLTEIGWFFEVSRDGGSNRRSLVHDIELPRHVELTRSEWESVWKEHGGIPEDHDMWAGMDVLPVEQFPAKDDDFPVIDDDDIPHYLWAEDESDEPDARVVNRHGHKWVPGVTTERYQCGHGRYLAWVRVSGRGRYSYSWACPRQYERGPKTTGCESDWMEKSEGNAIRRILGVPEMDPSGGGHPPSPSP